MSKSTPSKRTGFAATAVGIHTDASQYSTGADAAKAILCSQADAWKMLAIGKTLGSELISSGKLESICIGSRRLVKIASVYRLAGIEAGHDGEA